MGQNVRTVFKTMISYLQRFTIGRNCPTNIVGEPYGGALQIHIKSWFLVYNLSTVTPQYFHAKLAGVFFLLELQRC